MFKKIIDYLSYALKKFDPYITKYLMTPNVNKFTRNLVFWGFLLIINAKAPVWFPFATALFEQYTGIHINNTMEPVDWACLYIGSAMVLLGAVVFVLKMLLDYKEKKMEKTKNLLMIQHSSIEGVADFSKMKNDLSKCQISKVEIDQVNDMKRFMASGIESALEKQLDAVQEAKAFISRGTNFDTVYMGLAHIPLVFLLGFQLADKCQLDYMEWNQNDMLWELISGNIDQYPKLKRFPDEDIQPSDMVGDIAIKIGVTYPIDDSDLNDLNKEFMKVFNLQLDKPERNVIKSVSQLVEYKRVFRELLDEINQKYLGLKNIHIFYSGQTSLAFVLGSALSERMDGNIFVYNHIRTENPRYAWSLKMFKKFTAIGDVFDYYGG